MISNDQYVRLSLELNLFFLRIVKEHNIFAAASLPPKDAPISMKLVSMNRSLDRLLSLTISLAQGNIGNDAMNSGEIVTKYTMPSEKAANFLTGIPINTSITQKEMSLGRKQNYNMSANIVNNISMLNKRAFGEVSNVIRFQNNMLTQVLSCKAFGYTYPTNLKHVIREARAYVNMLGKLESRQGKGTTLKDLIDDEIFWNDIMGEHSKFIRGYLDPSENNLFNTANNFADKFDKLNEATKALLTDQSNTSEVTKESYDLVTQLRNFKIAGTEGLLACKIKAIMPALLADHVTREANYYLRLLSTYKM